MHRYKIKQGEEHRLFGGDGVRNLGNGFVESDDELNSPYLEEVKEEDQPAAPAISAPQAPAVPAPAPAPQLPAASAKPADQGGNE